MSLNFTYLPRTLEAVIFQASSRYKGVMVTGMRQVGKSTMLRRMMGDRATSISTAIRLWIWLDKLRMPFSSSIRYLC